MNLSNFMFPIQERPVAIHNGQVNFTDWENNDTYLANDYKAIVREDTNEPISIVRNSYKIVPNEVLINKLMHELLTLDTPFKIDPSHSFVDNARMRLQVTFPEITIRDSGSDIALSLFLHNSYDLSEGVRMFFGGIRAICTNGMVFGKLLARFYHRHTQGFQIENLKSSLVKAYTALPQIQERIQHLEALPVTEEIKEKVETDIGKRIAKEVLTDRPMSQYQLYDAITYIISHSVEQHLRARHQQALSRIFGL